MRKNGIRRGSWGNLVITGVGEYLHSRIIPLFRFVPDLSFLLQPERPTDEDAALRCSPLERSGRVEVPACADGTAAAAAAAAGAGRGSAGGGGCRAGLLQGPGDPAQVLSATRARDHNLG